MLAVAIGLLLILAIALLILGLVALPQIRSGSRILTPTGGRVVGQALETAKHKPVAAVGGTWRVVVVITHGLVAARRRISAAWAPISAALHEAMDRLEAKSASETPVSPVTAEPSQVTAPAELVGQSAPAERQSAPAEPVERPAMPQRQMISRPVPTGPRRDRFDVAAIIAGRSVGAPRPVPPVSGPIEQVIDLRGDEDQDTDHETGAVRHAR